MKEGILVVSLDFELLWGVFDKINWQSNYSYFQNTKKVIPEVLRLFEEFGIGCTWATVGMLFNEDWDDWNSNIPDETPQYKNSHLSAYNFGKDIQSNSTLELCFAPQLIKLIGQFEKQEIGTHTYSHFYCLETGQNISHFESDIKKAIEIAKRNNLKINSLVFPRNQFNSDYLKLCYKLGIRNIRSNPENWYWRNTETDSIFRKIMRTSDAYFGGKDKIYSRNSLFIDEQLVEQKASRFLRPHSSNYILNKLKLTRVCNEMRICAKTGGIYHLWWHPHNFGNNPEKSLNDLRIILNRYKELKNEFGLRSMSMNELAASL